MLAQPLVDHAEIIDGLETVGLRAHRLLVHGAAIDERVDHGTLAAERAGAEVTAKVPLRWRLDSPRMLEVVAHKHAVALVDERLGVISVVLHRDIGVLDGVVEVCLVEVDEREVGRRMRNEGVVLVLVALEHLNRLVKLSNKPTGRARTQDEGANTG